MTKIVFKNVNQDIDEITVKEAASLVECDIKHVLMGNEPFVVVHTDKGETMTFNPKYYARITVKEEEKRLTCGDCEEWGTVNCPETYREPTGGDDICDSFVDASGSN